VDREGLRRARELARDWRARVGVRAGERFDVEATGQLVALAYPDRVGQRRSAGRGRYLLRNGTGVALAEGSSLGDAPWIVAAELDGARPESRVTLAAPATEAEVLEDFADDAVEDDVVEWQDGAVRAVRRQRLGAIVLRESPLRAPDPTRVAAAITGAVRAEGLDVLPWSDGARALRARVAFLRALDDAWPDWSDAALLASLDEWLAPHLSAVRTRDQLARLDLHGILADALPWRLRAQLDALAPTHVEVPSGSRIRVDYSDPAAPALAVRLQELFGLAETPRIGGARVPLTLQLLSPAHRPVQVTRDLAGFWRSSYFDVRKDLRGRYPKHPWPEDPLAAPPTARAKRRGE
jgi:ATP-dependent helicase HrpB